MGSFQVGGLATGLDTQSLISQLMAVEGQKMTKYQWRNQLWEVRQKGWQDVNSRLNTLKSAAASLTSITTWSPAPSVATSDATKVSGAITGGSPAAGNYQVTVSQLATTASWDATNTNAATANDTLTINQGASTWNVAVTAGDTQADIRDAINGTAGIGVTASVVGGQLRMVANGTGAGQDFNVSSAGSLATDIGMAQSVVGQDANFTVNGSGYVRSSNTVSGIIADVDLQLNAVSGAAVDIDVTGNTADPEKLKDSLKDFIGQYNSTLEFIKTKANEDRVINPGTLDDYLKGALSRDSGLRSVEADLRRWVNDVVAGLPEGMNSLADIGITTGGWSGGFNPDNVAGKLEFDETVFDTAFAADPTGVEDMLRNGNGGAALTDLGIMDRMDTLVGQLTAGGRVEAAIDGASSQMQTIQDTMDRLQMRLDQKKLRYEAMFARLEEQLSILQNQSAWLEGQLASLPQAG